MSSPQLTIDLTDTCGYSIRNQRAEVRSQQQMISLLKIVTYYRLWLRNIYSPLFRPALHLGHKATMI